MQTWILVDGVASIPSVGGSTSLYPGTMLNVDVWAKPTDLGGTWSDYFTAESASRIPRPGAGKIAFLLASPSGAVRTRAGGVFYVGAGSIVYVDVGVTIPITSGAWISVPVPT